MFLREYLYVDIDKVRGILSQMEDGVPESIKQIERKEKEAELRNKILGGFGRKAVDEESIEKSLGDSLFKILEDELDSRQILHDISDEMQTLEGASRTHEALRPGTLVRLTAPGKLFHPSQLSDAMVGIATAATGLGQLTELIDSSAGQTQTSNPRRGQGRPKGRPKRDDLEGVPEDAMMYLPDQIPYFGLSRDSISGMIKFVRGIFSDGVHLQLSPLGYDGPTVTARLESGRRFLDSTPEVLFSRYGFRDQEWTIVGTIGQLGELNPTDVSEFEPEEFSTRAGIVKTLGEFLQIAGNSGLIDLPTGLGFSVVPLAVYRAIGWDSEEPPQPDPDESQT